MLSSMLCGRRTSISNFYLLLTKWSHCPSSKLMLQVIPHPSLSQFPPPPAGMTFLLAYSARDALILLFELAIPPQNRNFNNKAKKGLRDRNSPTCTLSQNGYGEHFALRNGITTCSFLELLPATSGYCQANNANKATSRRNFVPSCVVTTRINFFLEAWVSRAGART